MTRHLGIPSSEVPRIILINLSPLRERHDLCADQPTSRRRCSHVESTRRPFRQRAPPTPEAVRLQDRPSPPRSAHRHRCHSKAALSRQRSVLRRQRRRAVPWNPRPVSVSAPGERELEPSTFCRASPSPYAAARKRPRPEKGKEKEQEKEEVCVQCVRAWTCE